MSVRYNDDFKREVVRAYMAGDKSTVEIDAEYNIAKSTIREWAKKYGEECQYKHTTQNISESDSASEIRKLNQMLKEKDKDYFGLRWLCRRFGISPNGYYNYLKDTKGEYHEQRAAIFERIKYIYYNNNRTVGHRAMRIFLPQYDICLSKTTVHKYMNKILNLAAIIMRKKSGYTAGKKHKIFNNLLNQDFTVDEKNKVWCTDFTYMRQPNGRFRYNCTIIDLSDRCAVASLNSDYINTDLAKDTLKAALNQELHPKTLILHSGQGQQFASWEFVMFCKEQGIKQSWMSL